MEPKGPVAEDIADLTLLLVVLGSAVFVAVVFLIAAALFRRRRDPDAPADTGPPMQGCDLDLGRLPRAFVLGGGVVLPTIIIAVVFGWTLETMRDLPREIPEDAIVVEVTAHQWWWEISYPGTGITAEDVIHIPVRRPVALEMRSVDVIHSLWVPRLAGKLDVLPDKTNTLIFSASEPGEYRGQCAEFCGLGHSDMELRVVALDDADYDAWLQGEGAR